MIELQNKLDEMQSQINTYLSPENIKKDVTILGVLGNLITANITGIPIYSNISQMEDIGISTNNLAIVYDTTNNIFTGLYEKNGSNWELSNTGLTANLENVAFSTFYSSNLGVQQGTLEINSNLSISNIQQKAIIFDRFDKLDTNESDLSDLMTNSNIKSFPNLSMANVTNIINIFYNCQSLCNIPILNLSNVNNATNMFYNCTNLSALTYSNITEMLPLANNLSNQYLSNLGLDIDNFTENQLNILNTKGYIDASIVAKPYYDIYYN